MVKEEEEVSHKYLDCIKFRQTQRITDTALILSSYTNPRANKKQLCFPLNSSHLNVLPVVPPVVMLMLYIWSARLFYALPSIAIRILFFT